MNDEPSYRPDELREPPSNPAARHIETLPFSIQIQFAPVGKNVGFQARPPDRVPVAVINGNAVAGFASPAHAKVFALAVPVQQSLQKMVNSLLEWGNDKQRTRFTPQIQEAMDLCNQFNAAMREVLVPPPEKRIIIPSSIVGG